MLAFNVVRLTLITWLMLTALSINAREQKVDLDEVICYRAQIKNPGSHLGNRNDLIELTNGSKFTIVESGGYLYTSYSGKNVLVCPDIHRMYYGNSAVVIKEQLKTGF